MNKRGQDNIVGRPIPDVPGPRRSELPWIEIVRPTWERPVEATLLSLRWRAFEIHWDKNLGRTVPCPGEGCALCKEIGLHWYAWAVAVNHRGKRLCIVEVTHKGWLWGPQALCDQEAVVRGLGIRLRRKTKSRTAAVIVESIPPEFSSSVLPPPMDPKPLLLRLWGYVEDASSKNAADVTYQTAVQTGQ